MLLDVRTYTCRPGTIKKHLALYAEHGFAIQSRHLGKPLAYAQIETGNVNSYMHIWVYDSAADREAGLAGRCSVIAGERARVMAAVRSVVGSIPM